MMFTVCKTEYAGFGFLICFVKNWNISTGSCGISDISSSILSLMRTHSLCFAHDSVSAAIIVSPTAWWPSRYEFQRLGLYDASLSWPTSSKAE
jgi:hypothetical protein